MIITISGQYGSGGNEVGDRLAEILNYKILDTQLIVRSREIYFEKSKSADKPDWWPKRKLTSFQETNDSPRLGSALWQAELDLKNDIITYDTSYKDFGAESGSFRRAMLESLTQSVLECVEGGNCIIYGKCSDYILRGRPDAIHAFATADMEVRINRTLNRYNFSSEKVKAPKWLPMSYTLQEAGYLLNMDRRDAIELIYTTDRRRSDLFEFLTGEKWGDPEHFDYQLVGDDLNVDDLANSFLQYVQKRAEESGIAT